MLFIESEAAVGVALDLIDKDAYASQKYITEYPVLTELARYQNPSKALLEKLKSYLASKPADFAYLNKLSLIYSTLVKTYCTNNECDQSELVF